MIEENAAEIFSSLLGMGSMSVVNIIGVPKSDICLMISERVKSFLLLTEISWPLRSRRAMPVVAPGSMPAIRSFFLARIIPPYRMVRGDKYKL